jgi:7,8-dihydropterin-6-yl-methyl-4-(beta-D-ribofuranosyl)aminobenzene 5'-phosphate synthase
MTVTILMENYASRPDLHAEHGLSIHIGETDSAGGTVFDTGASDRFVHNGEVLKLDLARTEQIVLSHGHYDHTGGLPALLDRAPGARVFCHPDALIPRYSIKDAAAPREIGIPDASRIRLREHSFLKTQQRTPVTARLHATGEIPRSTSYEDTGGPFFLDEAGLRPDPIRDDQALWFISEGALVIVLGCAHAGVINTIETCRQQSGVDPVRAIIGGFHLVNADARRLDRTVDALKRVNPEVLAACHCTGEAATERLRHEFPGQFQEVHAGSVFVFS